MTSRVKFVPAQRYKIGYSKTYFTFEIILFLGIFICLLMSVNGGWLFALSVLWLLSGIHYFSTFSVMQLYAKPCVLEFRNKPQRLIWYDQQGETSFAGAQVKIYISRWFVLIKLCHSSVQINRLLMADSFDDINHYTRFRCQLTEMIDASRF